MRKLHLVGLTTDRDGLIFTARKGSKSGGFIVPLDDTVVAAVAEARADRNGVPVADAGLLEVEAVPRRPRHQSALTPREMQARLRAGRSIDDVAAEAGVDNDWVARFAVPILAEQAQVVELARGLVYAKPRLGESSERLGTSVLQNLSDRGIYLPDDVADAGWSAFQLRDAVWMVRFRYRSRGKAQEAQWEIDVPTGRLLARNRNASDLGYLDAGRRRGMIVDEDQDEADAQPPRRSTKRAPAKRAATKRAPTKRATVKRATVKRVPARRAPAKATTQAPAKAGSRAVKAPAARKAVSRQPARATVAKTSAKKSAARKAPTRKATPTRKSPAKAVPAPEPGPSARSGGVRSAVAQVSTARVSASLAVAERSPWAAVVRTSGGLRPVPVHQRNEVVRGRVTRSAPMDARRVELEEPVAVPAFVPRPLPSADEVAATERVRRVSTSTAGSRGGAPTVGVVSTPTPRRAAARKEQLPVERPKRRRLRSR